MYQQHGGMYQQHGGVRHTALLPCTAAGVQPGEVHCCTCERHSCACMPAAAPLLAYLPVQPPALRCSCCRRCSERRRWPAGTSAGTAAGTANLARCPPLHSACRAGACQQQAAGHRQPRTLSSAWVLGTVKRAARMAALASTFSHRASPRPCNMCGGCCWQAWRQGQASGSMMHQLKGPAVGGRIGTATPLASPAEPKAWLPGQPSTQG